RKHPAKRVTHPLHRLDRDHSRPERHEHPRELPRARREIDHRAARPDRELPSQVVDRLLGEPGPPPLVGLSTDVEPNRRRPMNLWHVLSSPRPARCHTPVLACPANLPRELAEPWEEETMAIDEAARHRLHSKL